MSNNIVQFNEEIIKGQIKELVRGMPKNAGKYYYKSGSAKPQINSAGGPKNRHK